MYSSAGLTDDPALQLLLLNAEVEKDPRSETHRERQANLELHVSTTIQRIDDPFVREVTQNVLVQIVRLLDWLSLIETNFNKLDTLRENLSLLELVHLEARSLLDFIANAVTPADTVTEIFSEVLDGIAYTIMHDLRRVFECEIVGSIANEPTPMVYGKIVHAHGLLTNCLQQSTITLVQLFDPSLDGSNLFNDSEQRLEQSLLLCRDLSSLIRVVRRVQKRPEPGELSGLVEHMMEFRNRSMHYLMYRDWKGYEKLAHEILMSIGHRSDPVPLLHQFLCYLEALFGHVRMRAVLTNMDVRSLDEIAMDLETTVANPPNPGYDLQAAFAAYERERQRMSR